MLIACSAQDYKEPAVGLTGVGGVEQCRQFVQYPCGWVYWFEGADIEFCLPWDDRAEIPKLRETAESLYGNSELSRDSRFSGTPLCYYQCPSASGCNASGGCFCLEAAS